MSDKQKCVRVVIVPEHVPEPWVYSFYAVSKHARVERVETCHGPARDYGVMYVFDRGEVIPKLNPETQTIEDNGYKMSVVLVPIRPGAPTPMPDGCGKMLGLFSDSRVRWMVFSVASDAPAESASAPREKASSPAQSAPRQAPRAPQPASPTHSGTSPRPTGKPSS